jgi:type I restriction enzyme, S subunit
MSDHLPLGWVDTTLEGVLAVEDRAITDGPFGSKLASRHYTPSGARVIRLQNIGDCIFINEHAYISLDYFEELRAHEVRFGDLVIASLGQDLPKACIIPALGEPAIVKADCIRARIHPGIDTKWVLYALSAPQTRQRAASRIRGVGRPRLGLGEMRKLPIPLPPLSEQLRIIATLEDHLSRLDAAVVSALGAARKAVALRRRTLANLVAADSSGFWKKYKLEDVTTTVRNGMFVSRPGHEANGVPILRISAVRSLALDLSDLRYTAKSPEEVQREGYLLRGGDLLFTRYNGNPEYVGACAVVPENLEPLTYPDKLIRVSPDRSLVDPIYLAMTCSAGESRHAIRSAVKTTAGQAGISGGEIKRIPLRLPDLDEQRRRAAEFQEHDEAVRHIEENVRSVAKRGDYLRRSLLSEAFSGRLVPQDPAEEPASVLLERIRAERAAQLRARRRPKAAMRAPQKETLL